MNKSYKTAFSLLIMLFFLFFLPFAQSQESRQPAATDFTLTDTHGNTYNLYNELNNGKTVILDFFATTCGSCATTIPIISNLWHDNGGTASDLWVWGIEVYGVSNAEIDAFEQVNGGDFPCFSTAGNDSIVASYEIQYTPKFYVVCPDKRRIPSLIGDIQMNVNQCRQLSGMSSNQSQFPVVVFSSDRTNAYFSLSDIGSGIFEIFNTAGACIHKEKIKMDSNKHIVIPKTKISAGIYLYRIIDNSGKVFTGKFMVL